MVVFTFSILGKDNRIRFFEENFLLAAKYSSWNAFSNDE